MFPSLLRKLYLEDVDECFMIREGIKAVHTTVRVLFNPDHPSKYMNIQGK